VLVGNDKVHNCIFQEAVTTAGIAEDELQVLTSTPANALTFAERKNTSISSNGIPINHGHQRSKTYIGPVRPLMIKNNNGMFRVKVR
jgi:hypothetical protein